MAAVAMGLFGLGKTFRSDTHKAMIYTYLYLQGWQQQKTYVYAEPVPFLWQAVPSELCWASF